MKNAKKNLHLALLFITVFLMSTSAFATKRYWVGTGANKNWNATGNWSTASGGSSGASVPLSSDSVCFDGNGTGQCSINATVSVKAFEITPAYTDTVKQNSFSITVGTSGMTLGGGTFLGGNANINDQGIFTLSGCFFQSTSAVLLIQNNYIFSSGTFSHNNGEVKFTATSTLIGNTTFYKLTFSPISTSTFTISSGITLTVNNELKTTGSSVLAINTGNIDAKGDVTILNTSNTTLSGGTGSVTINGTGKQIFTGGTTIGYGRLCDIKINKLTDTLVLKNIISLSGDWAYTRGIVDAKMFNSTVAFVESTLRSISGINGLNNVILTSPTTAGSYNDILLSDTLTVFGELKIEGAGAVRIFNGTIKLKGDLTITNSSMNATSTGLIIMCGTADQTITGTLTALQGRLCKLNVDKPSGTLTLKNIISFADGAGIKLIRGTVDATTYSSTVIFTRSDITIRGKQTFHNLIFNTTGVTARVYIGATDTLVVNNDLKIEGADPVLIYDGTINAKGNIIITNTSTLYSGASANLNICGTGNQTLTGSGIINSGKLCNVNINKLSGTLSLAGIISLGNSWQYNTGTVSAGNSTVVFAASLNASCQGTGSTMDFNNVIVSGGTATLTGNLSARGNLTINSGTILNGNARNLTIGGNWDNSGTFNAANTTVILSGATQSITNGIFNNLEIAGTGTKSAASTLTVNGLLTINNTVTLDMQTYQLSGSTITSGGTGLLKTASTNSSPIPSGKSWSFGIEYAGTSSTSDVQTGTYNDLTLSGSRETASVILPIGTVSISGVFTNSATFTSGGFITTGNDIDYNGTGAQTITPFNYNNLSISGIRTTSNVTLSTAGTIGIAGTFINSASFSSGIVYNSGSTISLNGNTNQTIASPVFSHLKELIIDKPAGQVILGSSITIDSLLTLTKGPIISDNSNLVVLNNGASVSGASDLSYVSGPITKIGNTAFIFPVGKSNNYQPISISAPTNNAAAYTAEYFHSDANLGTAKDSTIQDISNCEYWTLNNVGTAYPISITLGWNSQSCEATQGYMRLTEWDGTKWIDLGDSSHISGFVNSVLPVSTLGVFTLAQKAEITCGFDLLLGNITTDSISKMNFDSVIVNIDRQVAANTNGNRALVQANNYVVPVVFHIIGDGTAAAITDAQIQAQLQLMNDGFANLLGSTFGVSDDAQIRFCLAQTAPSGVIWSTTLNGTTRFQTQQPAIDISNNHDMSTGSANGQAALTGIVYCDQSKYLNIWVVNSIRETPGGANNILGYSPFPLLAGTSSQFLDGVVMRSDCFGIGTANLHYNQGGTLIHELGHYFGLFHTFQNECSELTADHTCNGDGDRCCDTPPVATANQHACNFVPTPNSCHEPAPDLNDMFENHMDYIYDQPGSCRNTFTNDQANRMHAEIQQYRSTLVSVSNLILTGLTGATGCLQNFVNPTFVTNQPGGSTQVCTNQAIGFIAIQGASSYTWTFPGGIPGTATIYNPTNIVFSTPGVQNVSLDITDASGNHLSSTLQIFVSNCVPYIGNKGNWYFGNHAALSFSSGQAIAISPSSIITKDASSTVNDNGGNLLFYTNGRSVWNSAHTIMTNGNNSLNGSPNSTCVNTISATKGVVSIPRPGTTNRYYIYTVSDNDGPCGTNWGYGVSQYEVDMTSPPGTVVNTIPVNPSQNYATTESIIAVPHCNGNDYWIIVKPTNNTQPGLGLNAGPQSNVNTFIASYLVNSIGISNVPVLSSSGPFVPPMTYPGGNNWILHSAVSPDKRFIAFSDIMSQNCYLYGFDCSSGALNYLTTLNNALGCGVSFSPDSKVLYMFSKISSKKIRQYDLTNFNTCNINPPFKEFGYVPVGTPAALTPNLFGCFQLGPDGKIYITRGSFGANIQRILAVINFPNNINISSTSNECGYNYNGVYLLGTQSCNLDLPNDIDGTVIPPIDDFSFCITNCANTCFTNLGCGTNFTWDFGDGNAIVGINSLIPAGTNGGTTTGNFEYPCHTYAQPGSYVVTLTIDGRPTIIHNVNITLPALPSILGPNPVCNTSTIPESYFGPIGFNYSWTATNGNPTTGVLQSFDVTWTSFPATLNLTITDPANGCTNTNTINITQTNILPIANAGQDFTICSGNSTVLNGTGVGSYVWTPNIDLNCNTCPNPIASPIITTVYSLGVSNGCGTNTDNVTVTVTTTQPTVAVPSNITICATSSIPTTSFSSTPAGATYAWTNSNPAIGLAANGAGNIPSFTSTNTTGLPIFGIITVTPTLGCVGVPSSYTITVNPTPTTPSANSNSPVCEGATIDLTIPLIAGATYSWSGPNGFTSAIQNPSTAASTAAMAGTYSVTVTQAGCTSLTGTTTVVVNPTPATPSAGSNTPVCAGGVINLTTPLVAGATYSWTGSNAFTSTLQNPNTAASTAAMAGTYSVTVTQAGCTSLAGTITVVVNPIPATPTAGSNASVCAGTVINLTTPLVAGATYSWTGPNGFTSTLQNASTAASTAAMAGIYSVTVTQTGCTSLAGTTTVVVNPIPTAPIAGSNTPVCSGSVINLTTALVAGAAYNWIGPVGYSANLQNPSTAPSTTAMAGIYSVTVGLLGCKSLPGLTTVVVNATPATPTAGSSSPVCAGSVINLTTPLVTGATYSWTGPNGFASTIQNPSTAASTAAMAGTYSVTVTQTGCTSLAGTTTVVVNAIPATPTATSNSAVCAGSVINLTTSLVAAATYGWTGPNTFSSTLQNPNTTASTSLMAGTYSVTVTQAGCTSLAGTTTVIVNPIPATPTAGSNTPVCAGTVINLTTPLVAGANYSWTGPNGFTSTLQNASTVASTTAMAGVYSVTVTQNACTSLAGTTMVVVNPMPATPTANNNSPVCEGSVINLSTTAISGATYNWTGPNGFTSTLQNPIRTGATTAMAGTYSVTVTQSGCTSLAGTTTVVVNPSPTAPTAGSNTPVCAGSVINLTTPLVSGAIYNWIGPVGFSSTLQNPTITGATAAMAGVYSVTVTQAGCKSLAGSTTVIVIPTPIITVSPAPATILQGTSIQLFATNTTGIGTNYSWSPATGLSNTTIANPIANPTVTTTYTVTGTTVIGGCISTTTIDVTVSYPCTNAETALLAPEYPGPNHITTVLGIIGAGGSGSGYYSPSALNTVIASGSVCFGCVGGGGPYYPLKILMPKDARITVMPGATLTIAGNSSIWACSDDMWEGIDVREGGHLIIAGTPNAVIITIEDAKNAIHILNTPTIEAKFEISGAYFNKNYKALVVEPYNGNHTGKIYGSIFRSISSGSYPYSPLGLITTLKRPYDIAAPGIKRGANTAIELNGVKSIDIGVTAATSGAFTYYNTFAGIEIGIHSMNGTNLNSFQNVFENINYTKQNVAGVISYLTTTTGMGIWAQNQGSVVVGGPVGAAGNTFNYCSYGIVTSNNIKLDAQNNKFNFMNYIPALNTNNNLYTSILVSNSNQLITLKNNQFKSVKRGIALSGISSTANITLNSFKNLTNTCIDLRNYSGDVNFIANDFQNFAADGIYCLQNLGGKLSIQTNTFTNSANNTTSNAIRVENAIVNNKFSNIIWHNIIKNSHIGIKCTLVPGVDISQGNSISYTTTAHLPADIGIELNNCRNAFVDNNTIAKIGA